jgi:hypothetical protein
VSKSELKPPVSVEEKSRDPSTPARGVARSSAGEERKQKCWNCKQAIRHANGTVTCIVLSRLEKKVITFEKGTIASECQAFEPRPKGYKLPKNFRLFI